MQQLESSEKDTQGIEQAISETLANFGEEGPSNRELFQLLQQQAQLISKYQARVDHTNATLLQNQKMLQRISTKLEVCFTLEQLKDVVARRSVSACSLLDTCLILFLDLEFVS